MLWILLACGPEPLPETADAFKSGGRENLVRGKQVMFTYSSSVVINEGGSDNPRLFILEGRKTDDGYHATKLGVGEIYSGLFDSWWTLVGECTGEMVEVQGVVTFTTAGPEPCEKFAGEWLVEEDKKTSSAPAALPDTPCGLYTQCMCDLQTAWIAAGGQAPNPFSQGCADARSLLSSGADDPATCDGGRLIFSSVALEAGMTVPESCTK